MTVCERVQRHDIHLYLDNELSPADVLELEKHLMECAACRAVYQNLRTVVDVVRGAQPLYEAPDASFRKAQHMVARRQRVKSRFAEPTTYGRILRLRGTDWLANYQAVLRSVTYRNTSEKPSTAARTPITTSTSRSS